MGEVFEILKIIKENTLLTFLLELIIVIFRLNLDKPGGVKQRYVNPTSTAKQTNNIHNFSSSTTAQEIFILNNPFGKALRWILKKNLPH